MSLRGHRSRRLYRQKLGAKSRVLLISISLATTQGLAQGQQLSAPRQTPSAPSVAAPEKSGENETASLEHGSLDQKASSSCSTNELSSQHSSRRLKFSECRSECRSFSRDYPPTDPTLAITHPAEPSIQQKFFLTLGLLYTPAEPMCLAQQML